MWLNGPKSVPERKKSQNSNQSPTTYGVTSKLHPLTPLQYRTAEKGYNNNNKN